jgi:riboflavin kinase/FMN adenylyltransferase
MNLGVRPTFGDGGAVKLEVHLPGFERDLAGSLIAVELVERIRDERRFEGPEALAAAIAYDVEAARKILRDRV